MTQENNTDRQIKNLFENYEPQVPPTLWDKIEARRKNDDDDRPVAFWLNPKTSRMAAAVLLLLLAGGAYFYNDWGRKKEIETVKQELPVNIQPSANTTKSLPAPNNQKNTTTLVGENKNETAPIEKENIVATKNKNDLFNDFPQKNTVSSGKSSFKRRAKTLVQIINAQPDAEIIASSDAQKNKKQNSGFNKNGHEEEMQLPFTLQNNLLKLSVSNAGIKNSLQVKKLALTGIFVPCPEAEKNAAANKTYFEIYAGPDYAFRKLTDSANSTYLAMRKKTATPAFAFSAGLRYNRVFTNGISVRASINYSQVHEKFSYQQGNIVHLIYIINTTGDTTGSYYSNSTRYLKSTNKYYSIDIPLAMGYEMGNGNLHININAGPVINIRSWQKGYVVDPNNNVVDISTGKSNSGYGFKTNAGLGAMAAVSFYYKFSERAHLMAEPYFRYNFSPISKPAETLQQRHHIAGMRLGLRMDL